MSFRSRMLARNSIVTARFVPVYQASSLDGETLFTPIVESDKRLYEDMTLKKMLDSGIPLRQFTPSPDTSTLQQSIAQDADLSVVNGILEENGYDTSKPMSSQNVSRSKVQRSETKQVVSDPASNNSNNEVNNQ